MKKKDLGKVTFKFKLGGGLNAICLAGAGAIAVHSITKFGDWIIANDLKKLVNEGNTVLGKLKEGVGLNESNFEE